MDFIASDSWVLNFLSRSILVSFEGILGEMSFDLLHKIAQVVVDVAAVVLEDFADCFEYFLWDHPAIRRVK